MSEPTIKTLLLELEERVKERCPEAEVSARLNIQGGYIVTISTGNVYDEDENYAVYKKDDEWEFVRVYVGAIA